MSSLRGDATAKPRDNVRELKVGGHDMVEDQWRGETDSVTQVLLNNQVSTNPGLVVMEAVPVASDPATITVSKAIDTLHGVVAFVGASGILEITGTTGAAKDADQVANPGVIDLTGTTVDGVILVFYTAL
jgi:hypothetical protein